MREILFRGKRTNNGEWVEGFYLNRTNDDENIHCIMEKFPATIGKKVIPETVGQYTGLTDCNGKKIFEGDIVECAKEDELLVIEWSESEAKFMLSASTFICSFDNYWGYETEIIGNIHDNPELLN